MSCAHAHSLSRELARQKSAAGNPESHRKTVGCKSAIGSPGHAPANPAVSEGNDCERARKTDHRRGNTKIPIGMPIRSAPSQAPFESIRLTAPPPLAKSIPDPWRTPFREWEFFIQK